MSKQHKDEKGYDINVGDGVLYLKEDGGKIYATGNVITSITRSGVPVRTRVVSFPLTFEKDGRTVNAVNIKRSRYQK